MNIEEDRHFYRILHILEQFRQSNLFVDVTLTNGINFWKAHKLILSANSTVLKDFFEHNPCEKAFIYLYGIRDDTINILMNYMYKGDNSGSDDNDQIRNLATHLDIKGLKRRITDPPPAEGTFTSQQLQVRQRPTSNVPLEETSRIIQRVDLDNTREQMRDSDSQKQRKRKTTPEKLQSPQTHRTYKQDVTDSRRESSSDKEILPLAKQYEESSGSLKIDESYSEEETESKDLSTASDQCGTSLSEEQMKQSLAMSQSALALPRQRISDYGHSKRHSESSQKDNSRRLSKKRVSGRDSSESTESSQKDSDNVGLDQPKKIKISKKRATKRSEPSQQDILEAGPSHSAESTQSASEKRDSSISSTKCADNFKYYFSEKKLNEKSSLKEPLETQSRKTSFVCYICNGNFYSKGNLNIHLMRHYGEKPHQCEFCEYKCPSRWELKSHERTHTGERPFSCPFCDKTFSTKGNLSSHIKSHTGEKSYKCKMCSQSFTHKHYLDNHILKKH